MSLYDELSESYDSRYKSDMSQRENEAVKSILDWFITPTSTVLDVGCGTGFALDINRKIDAKDRYLGLDISDKMLDKARRKYPDAMFIKGDARYIFGRFDIALSLFSIPYIGKESIFHIKDHLRDGGVFIAVYYNKPYLNGDSVYAGHKWKYKLLVHPKVKSFIKKCKREMKLMQEGFLTKDETYRYSIFKEYKK